jgi:DNA mismatch repair protein MSH6
VAPLLQAPHIRERQKAVGELMAFTQQEELKTQMKKIPDLERLLLKIHTAGNANRSRSHPDSRAIMFENSIYSRRKIADLLACLEGFSRSLKIIDLFEGADFSSKLLKNASQLQSRGGQFPDLAALLDYFDNAFDQASARKEGFIVPRKGVDPDLDAADAELEQIKTELADYLREQKKHFGCDVKYWGTGKNRFQLEVPAEKVNRAGSQYELASGTKKLKRYVTEETKGFLERQLSAETDREKALLDIQRKSESTTIYCKALAFSAHISTVVPFL